MIDYLLKFPSKDIAIQFGAMAGLASQDENGEWRASPATHSHSLLEIGEHYKLTGNIITDEDGLEYVEKIGDGNYWVLYRDLTGIPVPDGAEQFIFWSSRHGESRPKDESIAPTLFWA